MDETRFILYLEYLRETYSLDKVIFNGDVFELLKYTIDDIRKAYPVLMKYFQDRSFVFIKGNHDIVNSKDLDHYQLTNSKGQIIHIEHGHNADWFNGSKFGQAISKLGFSILKKFAGSRYMLDTYFRIVAIDEAINYIPKRFNTI